MKYQIGKFHDVSVIVDLDSQEELSNVNLNDLPQSIKNDILHLRKEQSKQSILQFVNSQLQYELDYTSYKELVKYQTSIFRHRSVDDSQYLHYLLQSYTIPDLKIMCRTFNIKGYSNLKKQDLIQYIIDYLSEEERLDFLREHELEIIEQEFNKALAILKTGKPEKYISSKVINQGRGEIEATFEGLRWTSTTYLSINKENLGDPERDCDCIIGSNNGFCPHFWICFLLSFKKKFFSIKDWKLTILPSNFKKILGAEVNTEDRNG